MASTYSESLKLELIGDGDQSGTWGSTTNRNLGTLLEQAITGVRTITMVNANYVLTNFNGVSDEARNAVLVVQGTISAIRQVVAPLEPKLYVVYNNTTGGYAITIGASSGAVISIPNGVTAQVYCDGTNFYSSQTGSAGNFTVNGNLNASGNLAVTGTSTFTGASAFTGNAAMAGNLAVTGTSTLTGNATMAGTLAVTGASTLTGGVAGNLVLNGSTSGAVTVSVPAVAGSSTAAFPAATGTVMVSGNQPAFKATNAAGQTYTSGVSAKQLFGTLDATFPNTGFSSSTFTPTVAGYYQVNGWIYAGSNTALTSAAFSFYKNGVIGTAGYVTGNGFGTSVNVGLAGSDIFYCNGTTDYIEIYVTMVGTATLNVSLAVFSGCLIRTA